MDTKLLTSCQNTFYKFVNPRTILHLQNPRNPIPSHPNSTDESHLSICLVSIDLTKCLKYTLFTPHLTHLQQLTPRRSRLSSSTAIIRSSSPKNSPSRRAPNSQTKSSPPATSPNATPVPNSLMSSSARTSAA